ncbi:MAG: HPr(Ser) kinase/phosphatase [Gemmatimonadetes bacterium]|jgi:HPr kinase/phosphorylase|nr:HPr(Ser) kinase/phosphatase [Gemmatimonadota bacterium]
MRSLTVEELLRTKREALHLELLTDERGLSHSIPGPDISSPGLALTGYTERFPADRVQVLGETEISFLASLDPERRTGALETFFAFDIPVVFITKGQPPPEPLVTVALARGVPVIRTALKTSDFYARIKPFLEDRFALATTMHGSLADVYGVGLLFVGKSGIGKSEAVLDLIERGHRLVADDMVLISRRGNEVLIGRGHELQRHHMEIRGIGIIDIARLFGIRAIRQQKRVEVIVQLEIWDQQGEYDRTGLEPQFVEVLGVPIPKVIVPLNPGKNITVIAEVVAMNHLMKYAGIDSAARFNQRLQNRMRTPGEYLEEDDE